MTTPPLTDPDLTTVDGTHVGVVEASRLVRPVQPLYVDVSEDQVFAVHHRPAADLVRDCAVVLCPPFGWEEEASHRSFRAWAKQLAAAGYPVIRLNYPGAGDSSGRPTEPARLDAWTRSVTAVADWIREASGARSVIALGMGFGSMVAYCAAASGTALDGLVLWAPPSRGREIVRQLRAFSRLEQAESFDGLPAPPARPEGEFSAGGFVLTAETVRDLEQLDLTTLQMPGLLPEGVLLLDRDGIGNTGKLRRALVDQGIDVTEHPGAGYADMTVGPQEARLSPTVARDVQAWLDERARQVPTPVSRAGSSCARTSTELDVDSAVVRETPVEIRRPSNRDLSAVLTEPTTASSDVCAVFLNAGAIHRAGPSRMWVETARRWAARGMPSLRLDAEGIGESDGSDLHYEDTARLHDPDLIMQVRRSLDFLESRGVAKRFILISMCAGAYWAFQVALDDPRVTAMFALNQRVLVWHDGLGPARDLRRALASRAFLRVRESDARARVRMILRWLLGAIVRQVRSTLTGGRSTMSVSSMTELALSRLLSSPTRATFVFAANEMLEHDLIRSGRMAELEAAPNVTVERIAVMNHTLRPLWAQEQAHTILDRALERELRALGHA